MKAQTLSISIPYNGCKKNCPYCISKMTGYIKGNENLFYSNIKKVVKFSNLADVTNVIFTSKGEPLDNFISLKIISSFFEEFPLELQTNGLSFLGDKKYLKDLFNFKFNVIAISIDNFDDIEKFRDVVKDKNFIWRATVNLVPKIFNYTFKEVFNKLRDVGFDQISLREITMPNFGFVNTQNSLNAMSWIKENILANNARIDIFKKEYEEVIRSGKRIRILPYGAVLYDVEDISVTHFDYCIQDESGGNDIRSLIFQEDGHLYTSWNSKASVIF